MKNLEKILHAITAAAQVEETRTFFKEILGMNQVCIGGSAALLCEHDIYLGREVHDIDVILDEATFNGVMSSLKAISKYFEVEFKRGSSHCKGQRSIALVLKSGTEINLLVGQPNGLWQSLEEIVKAKKSYNRPKDRRDLIIILG